MSKYRIKTRVRAINGFLEGRTGEIVYITDRQGACPIYTIKFDGISRTIDYAESDIQAEDLMDEPVDEELIVKSHTWDAFIPLNVDEDQFFREMAEVYPGYNQDYNIKRNRFKVSVVQGGEGPVPHVHVYYEHKGSKKDVAYICLGTAEYAPQHIKETKILNSQEKKDLITFFTTCREGAFTLDKNKKPIPASCWQECVDIWMQSYRPKDPSRYFKIDEETRLYVMPDYSEL